MTTSPRPQPRAVADSAWEMVRRWPGMRGEDKLAWHFLWRLSRGGLERVEVTAADIAADQGVTSDAGRARIKNLVNNSLVRVVRSERGTGIYTLELADPAEVSRARAIKWDGQFVFPFAEEPTTAGDTSVTTGTPVEHAQSIAVYRDVCLPAEAVTEDPPEEPPEDPTEVPRSKGITSKEYIPSPLPLTFSPSEGVETKTDRGTSGGSSAAIRTADASFHSDVSYWAERIQAHVACKNLFRGAAKSAARLVVRGVISENEMNELLEDIVRKRRLNKLDCPPSAYFNGAIKRKLQGKTS